MAAQVTFLSYLWLQTLMDTFLDCPEIVLKTVSYEKSSVKQKDPSDFKKKKQASEKTRASYWRWIVCTAVTIKKKKRKKESIKFVEKIWPVPGFEPGTTTPNVNAMYYGDVFSKEIKIN